MAPVELAPLRQQRAFGQLIRAARQLYGRYWRPLVLIGLTSIPILGVVKGLEWLVLVLTGGGSFGNGVSNTIGSVAEPIGFAVVAAVVITFIRELESGQRPGFVSRLPRDARPLLARGPGSDRGVAAGGF